MTTPTGRVRLVATLLAGALAAAGCSAGGSEPEADATESPAVSAPTSGPGLDPDSPDLDAALSQPVEDRVYPEVGDPGVDALHYDLDLAWTPDSRTLDAVETLTFRATEDAEEFQLDLGQALEVGSVTVDGAAAEYEHTGKDLVVTAPVRADDRYTAEIRYSGTPEPVEAPTTRNDLDTLGWTITPEGETWTMQEPFGAYSWYAVNDQPSDKALYDFTISVPSPWVGVANGELESRTRSGGNKVTEWHLDDPASSYVVTVAIGDYQRTRDRSRSGVPITYWTPRGGSPRLVRRLGVTADAVDWVEKRLGPYPFPTLGVVLVDSQSGMETQTMLTLGTGAYATSPQVLVHEVVHHWYGNLVTPADWRDVWMNEGMAMYLQAMFEADYYGTPLAATIRQWTVQEPAWRAESGPPAAYDPATFGESNIYYPPALMWHELRERIGSREFFSMVRAWPSVDEDGTSSREEYTAWIEERTGEELTAVFDSWLLSETSPLDAS